MSFEAIGLFGGTFDPIHNGHLLVADEILKKLPIKEIQFIPCFSPPHRSKPTANAADRLRMIQLAIKDKPHLSVNDIEIRRSTISYTIDTVKVLNKTLPHRSLCFVLSIDAFALFNEWYKPNEILNYCHLLVVDRTEFTLPKTEWLTTLTTHHETDDFNQLLQHRTGKIYFFHTSTLAIQAKLIREMLAQHNIPTEELPKAVANYIQQQSLYQ